MSEIGWFASGAWENDADPPDLRGKWLPCCQVDEGTCHDFDVHFDTREACEAYIRDVILPACVLAQLGGGG